MIKQSKIRSYDRLFHNRLKVLKKTTVPVKATFNNLQALKTRINGHDKDLHIMNKMFQHFQTITNKNIYKKTVTIKNHRLAIKNLTQLFTA